MAESTMIYLRIGEGKSLPRKDISGKSDPYCIVKVDNQIVARTATVWRDLEPFWGEEYTMFLPVGFTNLSVYVYDEDTIGDDDIIGRVTFDREVLSHSPNGIERWFPLSPVHMYNQLDVQGEIRIEAILYEEEGVKKCKARVIEVRDLPDRGRCNLEPMVKLYIGDNRLTPTALACNGNCARRSSMTVSLRQTVIELSKGGHIKAWIPDKQSDLEFNVEESLQNLKLMADVSVDSDPHHSSGQATVFLPKLKPSQVRDAWYKLFPAPQTNEMKSENLGSIRMKVRLTQECILPSSCYRPLVEILVNSATDPKSLEPTVLGLIEELHTADHAQLAYQLVRLFIGQDMVIPLLDYLTLREIKKSSNPRTLFRGNSLAAKCMEQFMKIVGMPYLSNTLKPAVDKIFEERKYCELDPNKTERKPSALRRLSLRPWDEHDRSLSVLTSYLDIAMSSILNSVQDCPSYMRVAFRNIAHRVSDHFGDDPVHEDAKYTAVSSFLFLRFFAPALLGPKLFNLRETHPDKNISRTLTILAKTVQKIGNIELPVHGGKEEWMGPLYKWIAFYVEEVKDFLDRLSDIQDEQVPGCDHRSTVFSQSVITKEGPLKKCRYRDTRLPKSYRFKKRYCWLSTENFLYAKTPGSQTRQFLPTRKILAVEGVDESAFQKQNVFQVVSKDYDDSFQILYLAAPDVNELNQWLSAIRKTTISNPNMLTLFHSGVFHKNKWTCCKRVLRTAGGCQWTHTHVTLSDWRDPLDPDCEAQMIFTQLLHSRNSLKQKFLGPRGASKDRTGCRKSFSDEDSMTIETNETESRYEKEKAVALKLLEVIDELDKAHKEFQKKAAKE